MSETDLVVTKECGRCKAVKPVTDFYKSSMLKGGYQAYCKECLASYTKIDKLRVRKPELVKEMAKKLNERERMVAHLLIDNPNLTYGEIGEYIGVSAATVMSYMKRGRLLKAIRSAASNEVIRMIPRAIQAYRDLLDQNENLGEKQKVATKILESEKLLGPNRMEIGVTDMRNESTERLRELIKEAKDFPDQVIQEAEVVE
jgi:predicted transcriptional regulator